MKAPRRPAPVSLEAEAEREQAFQQALIQQMLVPAGRQSLPRRFRRIARAIARLPGVREAVVLVSEPGGEPFAAGAYGVRWARLDRGIRSRFVEEFSARLTDGGSPDLREVRASLALQPEEHVEWFREELPSGTWKLAAGILLVFSSPLTAAILRRNKALFAATVKSILQSGGLSPWEVLFSEGLLSSITEGIVVSRHEDGIPRVVLANAGTERALGYAKDALLGLDAREIYAADEHARLQRLLRKGVRQAARSRAGRAELGPVQSRMRRADGTTLPVAISYKVLVNRQFASPSIYVIGIARDISQSEQAEQKFRKLLELLDTLDLAYFQADEAGSTIDPTETESRITGYTIEELQGFDRKKLYHDPAVRERLIERVRDKGGRLTSAVERMIRSDKNPIWVEGGLRIPKEGDREVGLEGIYRDVTDRIRLQGFLDLPTDEVVGDRKLYERIEQTARFDLDYLTSLGHQLQTPLGALVETLRSFEQGALSREKLLKMLPYVIGQAFVCSRLVRNLSYLDKILRGESFKSEKVPLVKLATETAIDFKHLLKENNLELEIHQDELRRHLLVEGHREMLRQVLVNLVDNAIKYSRPGTVIHVRGFEWPRGRICEISNEGLRLAAGEEEKIFERGFRTRHAQAIAQGTGFGLWLVRRILAAHDAKIRCSQEIEDGRTRVVFRIVFPHSRNPSSNRRVS